MAPVWRRLLCAATSTAMLAARVDADGCSGTVWEPTDCDFKTMVARIGTFIAGGAAPADDAALLAQYCPCKAMLGDLPRLTVVKACPAPAGGDPDPGAPAPGKPEAGAALVDGLSLAAGPVALQLAGGNALATLVRVTAAGDEIPAGRSYDGHPWEGVAPSLLGFDCSGGARARSHCRFVPPLVHFTPDLLTYSVPLFLKRQCDRNLGGG